MNTVSPLPRLIYKMVHVDNVEYILSTGICSSNHPLASDHYVNIGDTGLIERRATMTVPCDPKSVLTDYIPFYFCGKSLMLASIIHADENRRRFFDKGLPERLLTFDPRRIRQYSQKDLIFITCDVKTIVERCPVWCFTDGHPHHPQTQFYTSLEDMDKLRWSVIDKYPEVMTEDIRRCRQAEFLVRDYVPVDCIRSFYVRTDDVRKRIEKLVREKLADQKYVPVTTDYHYPFLFFHNKGRD